MTRLEALQNANVSLDIKSVLDPSFSRYGRVVDIDATEMIEMVKKTTEIPAEGTNYVPWLDSIDTMDKAKEFNQILCGELDEEWGLCWGHNNLLNGLEWHTCNEFNIGVTDLVLLLAKRCEVIDNKIDSSVVKAFYLPEGVTIEVYSDTLHYAPCEVSKDGFSCVVGLQRGTNTDLDPDVKNDPLLTAKNKWLLCHKDVTNLVEAGTVVGITGENLEVKTI